MSRSFLCLSRGSSARKNGCGCLPCNLTLHFTAERCAPLSQALSAWDFHPSSHLFHEWVNSRSSSRLRASSLESVIMGCSQWDKYKEVRGLAICVSQGFFVLPFRLHTRNRSRQVSTLLGGSWSTSQKRSSLRSGVVGCMDGAGAGI